MCDHICINVYMWIISADSWLSSLQLKMYGELKKTRLQITYIQQIFQRQALNN